SWTSTTPTRTRSRTGCSASGSQKRSRSTGKKMVATAVKKPVARKSQSRGGSQRVLALPFGFALALLGFAFIPEVQRTPSLLWSFLASSANLIACTAALFPRRRSLTLDVVLLQ